MAYHYAYMRDSMHAKWRSLVILEDSIGKLSTPVASTAAALAVALAIQKRDVQEKLLMPCNHCGKMHWFKGQMKPCPWKAVSKAEAHKEAQKAYGLIYEP